MTMKSGEKRQMMDLLPGVEQQRQQLLIGTFDSQFQFFQMQTDFAVPPSEPIYRNASFDICNKGNSFMTLQT